MQSYTRPDGFRVVPMERRRQWVLLAPHGYGRSNAGRVSMDTDGFGLYCGEGDRDDFRSVSLAHALDECVRQFVAATAAEKASA